MSRRKQRGHLEGQSRDDREAQTVEADLDQKAQGEVDAMLAGFIKRRFPKVIDLVAAGFFGDATKEERQNPVLKQACALFFAHGWRDPEGMRVIDAFADYGLERTPAQEKVLDAMRTSSFRCLQLEADIRSDDMQVACRDLMDGTPLPLELRGQLVELNRGDVIVGWFMRTTAGMRPLGVINLVPVKVAAQFEDALVRLAEAYPIPRADLGIEKPAPTFWLSYRVSQKARELELI